MDVVEVVGAPRIAKSGRSSAHLPPASPTVFVIERVTAMLGGNGNTTMSELAKPCGLPINGVKEHVGILECADLVVTAKIGRARQLQAWSGEPRRCDRVNRGTPPRLSTLESRLSYLGAS